MARASSSSDHLETPVPFRSPPGPTCSPLFDLGTTIVTVRHAPGLPRAPDHQSPVGLRTASGRKHQAERDERGKPRWPRRQNERWGPQPGSLAMTSTSTGENLAPGRSVLQVRSRLKLFEALPLPGSGGTRLRWLCFADLARQDLSLARIAEGHADGMAILAELGRADVAGPRLRWLCFADLAVPGPSRWARIAEMSRRRMAILAELRRARRPGGTPLTPRCVGGRAGGPASGASPPPAGD